MIPNGLDQMGVGADTNSVSARNQELGAAIDAILAGKPLPGDLDKVLKILAAKYPHCSAEQATSQG